MVLGDDAVCQTLVQFGAAVDANRSTAGCGDCLHQSCVGRAHSMDFSKAFQNPLNEAGIAGNGVFGAGKTKYRGLSTALRSGRDDGQYWLSYV